MIHQRLFIASILVGLCISQVALAESYVIAPNTAAPKGNLSPALLVIRNGGGTYIGETDDGRPIFDLPANSPLITKKSDYNVEFEIEPLGNRKIYEARELLVSYRPGKKPSRQDLADAGFEVVEDYERGTVLVIRPTQAIVLNQETINRLAILRQIEHAEFNHRCKVAPLEAQEFTGQDNAPPPVNDPLWDKLYGIRRVGTPEAWRNINPSPSPSSSNSQFGDDSEEIIVAVIDTGVDYRHADLRANMWVNPDEIPGNGKDDDGNGIIDDVHGASFVGGRASGDPMDDNGHGTHCAGTVGGVGNNGIGVVGVNRRVKIMALKFLDKDGYGTDIDYVK
ncbi:MAG: hypothetical protein CMJ78_05670 [Planctomycetaceae bacterium]|nr:hypothetical protein [Planctomycetaceae bacterium]